MVRLVFRPYTKVYDDRFARQNRYGPPPEFPLASTFPGIVHHLSGPNRHALTQTFHRRSWSVGSATTLLLSLRTMVCHHNTRTHVRLLGPCFKTGRSEPFCQHRRQAAKYALMHTTGIHNTCILNNSASRKHEL